MRDKVRREVVETLWHYLYPYQNRPIWEQLVLIISVDDPWKRFAIPIVQPLPNRWELAMAINRQEIAIFGDRVFEPLVKAVVSVDSSHRYIRQHSHSIDPGKSSIVEIDIMSKSVGRPKRYFIDTELWPLLKFRTKEKLLDELFSNAEAPNN